MKKVSVEVLEDASHPEGGYAVILLHGVESVPDGVTFRLKPVEARGATDPGVGGTWPQGDLRPRAIRKAQNGIELLIGPDIVEAPVLLPGTLGVVEVQGAGVRGEFLWPSIRPTARPRRRNLTVVKQQSQRAAASKPKDTTPNTSAKPAQAPAVAETLAGKAPARMLREGSSGGVAAQSSADSTGNIPVTALDHAVPATATVAEAIGANVVQLNVARDAAATASGDGRSGERTGARVRRGKDDNDVAWQAGDDARAGNRRHMSRRAAAIAASAAIVVSGAYLLFSERPDLADRAAQARRETAQVVQRAEAMPRSETADRSPGQGSTGAPSAREPQSEPQRQTMLAPTPATPVPTTAPGVETAAPSALPATATPAAPPVQEVTLRMRGGGFQITGELKGFDGTKFVIESRAAGLLTMDAARFECIGEACARPAAAILPLSERPSPSKPDVFRIEGAAALAGEFIPQLIRDYAQSIGANVSELPRDIGPTSAGQTSAGPNSMAQTATRFRIADTRGVELATIEVLPSGSAAGLSSLERGNAAIALVEKPHVAEVEARPAATARVRPGQPAPQPSEIVIGLDGIAAVAAPQNATTSISIELLAKVVAGQITDWFELGQAPGPIQLYLPPDGTGTVDTFSRQILRPRGLDISRTARRLGSEAEAADAAARDPRGLALVSLAQQRGAKTINLETTCGLIVRPSAFTVKTGEYPLVRRLSLQLAPQLSHPSARGLVRIAQSGDVQSALGAGRIVDQSIASLPIEEQAERMAWAANAPAAAFDAGELRQMLGDLEGATRLSVTFRFVSGTNEIDQRSRREIQRLAAALKEPELSGKRILLAGFTDSAGKLQANLSTSIKRAAQIRSALLAAAGSGIDARLVQVKGYGPLAPVGCNGTPEGTRVNRRVEVWVAGK